MPNAITPESVWQFGKRKEQNHGVQNNEEQSTSLVSSAILSIIIQFSPNSGLNTGYEHPLLRQIRERKSA